MESARPPPAPAPVALPLPTLPQPPPPLSPPSLDGTGTVQVRAVSTREARPLPGVTVALFREPSGVDAPPERTVSTDEAGRAVFAELRAGVFTLCARGAQYPEVCARGGVVAGGTWSVEPRLAPGAVLVGQVLRADGSPAAGVQLGAQASHDPGLEERIAWALEARTDAEGRYRLEGLPPGELWLRPASPEGQGPSRIVEGLKEGEEKRFDFQVAGFTPVTVRPGRGAGKPERSRRVPASPVLDRSRPPTFFELAGHVRMPDGTPAVGAWISMESPAPIGPCGNVPREYLHTRFDGSAFVIQPKTGATTVYAWLEDGRAGHIELDAREGERVVRDISLEETGAVTGRMAPRPPDGSLPHQPLSVDGKWFGAWQFTRADGGFVIAGLAPGAHALETKEGAVRFTIRAGERTELPGLLAAPP